MMAIVGRFAKVMCVFSISAVITGAPTLAGSHTWVVNEIFSNADGTLQFVELFCPNAGETFVGGKPISSNAKVSPGFPGNVIGPTTNKHLLIATTGFASLPGAPTPDLTMQDSFFSLTADSLQWHVYVPSILSFTAGELPTDGVRALSRNGDTESATPTNYAGARWPPPGASDLLIGKISPNGARLAFSWDDGGCLGRADHHIAYGFAGSLPSSPGGSFVVNGSKCDIGGSPYNWLSGVPAVPSGSFAWFLVLANDDDETEGSWGEESGGGERNGAVDSGVCAITSKDLTDTCGN